MQVLIGAGGWSYFNVPGEDSLHAYSQAFEFVEVNSTFYEYPTLKLVRHWREKVPEGFQFSVKCHQDLTHRYKLEPSEEAFNVIDKILKISEVLRAEFIVLQTPESFEFNTLKISLINDFFESIDARDIRIAWEIRMPEVRKKLPNNLIKLMEDKNIIHCTDISKNPPQIETDILYSRLFGLGEDNIYQFTDDELEIIAGAYEEGDFTKALLTFHTVKMYKDAARLKIYQTTGEFPMVTTATGLDSLKLLLADDAKFPATKAELIEAQGWKLMDMNQNKRIRLEEVLAKLPEGSYNNIFEVVNRIDLS